MIPGAWQRTSRAKTLPDPVCDAVFAANCGNGGPKAAVAVWEATAVTADFTAAAASLGRFASSGWCESLHQWSEMTHPDGGGDPEGRLDPSLPPAGIEQIRLSPRKRRGQSQGDVKSDVWVENRPKAPPAVDADALVDLTARLASLPPEVLAALHALFSGTPRQP